MEREYTVVNSPRCLERCVQHLYEVFTDEGYRVEIHKQVDGGKALCEEVIIGSRTLIRKIPSASVCVKVKLSALESDRITFDIVDMIDDMWLRFGGPVVNLNDLWLAQPIGMTCAILTKAHRQRKLRKLVRDVLTLFLATA